MNVDSDKGFIRYENLPISWRFFDRYKMIEPS